MSFTLAILKGICSFVSKVKNGEGNYMDNKFLNHISEMNKLATLNDKVMYCIDKGLLSKEVENELTFIKKNSCSCEILSYLRAYRESEREGVAKRSLVVAAIGVIFALFVLGITMMFDNAPAWAKSIYGLFLIIMVVFYLPKFSDSKIKQQTRFLINYLIESHEVKERTK